MGTNTADNTGKATGKPFVKGDPRINRKGRPKSFDKLRELAQQLANEQAQGNGGAPIIIDGHIATQAEMILRQMMKDNPEKFVEIAYGKVPAPVEVSGEIKVDVYKGYVTVSPDDFPDATEAKPE